MPSYDFQFSPPAPVASVAIAHPVSSVNSGILRGKLDTGADLTVIPDPWVATLGLKARSHLWARSFDGSFSFRPVYYIRLTIEGHTLDVVRCIATNRKYVLIGRNVLNKFVITLDGKALRFDLVPI